MEKKRIFSSRSCLRLWLASMLFFVGGGTAWAGSASAENTFVTVGVTANNPVGIVDVGNDFYIGTEDSSVEVTIAAKDDFDLVKPDPYNPPITINAGDSEDYAVEGIAPETMDGSGTIYVIKVDLDVGNGSGGGPDGDIDDPEDGVHGFVPGERSGDPCISRSGTTLTLQHLKLVALAPGLTGVEFEIVSSSKHKGYATNTKLPDEASSDFSFAASGYSYLSMAPVSGGKAVTDLYCKDYGGTCRIKATFYQAAGVPLPVRYLDIPRDADDDGISDQWEEDEVTTWNNQYGATETVGNAFFASTDDKEQKDPDGSGPLAEHTAVGDGLTVFQEYRGFDFRSVADWGGEENYRRLSAARKELLVEVDRSADTTVPALAAPKPEVVSALALTQSAFLDTAGVRLYYVVDNIVAPMASFSTDNAIVSYSAANYDTTDTAVLDRSRYIYLLFAFELAPISGGDQYGRAWHGWNGGIISCDALHAAVGGVNSASRFSALYSITIEERIANTVTHELGHAVQCSGDYEQWYSAPGLYLRVRPNYYPSEFLLWWQFDKVGSQLQAQLIPGAGVIDLAMDLYADSDVTVAEVENGIDALTTKYEADATTSLATKKAWRLDSDKVFIEHFSDGSSSSTWAPVRMQTDITSVMTYNRSVEHYKNIHFNNDTSSPAYAREIGEMDVRNNYSKVNYP